MGAQAAQARVVRGGHGRGQTRRVVPRQATGGRGRPVTVCAGARKREKKWMGYI